MNQIGYTIPEIVIGFIAVAAVLSWVGLVWHIGCFVVKALAGY